MLYINKCAYFYTEKVHNNSTGIRDITFIKALTLLLAVV